HTQQPLVPGASARARPWALLNVCAPGSPALVGKGEEWLRRALDRRAGGPRSREGSGGRGGPGRWRRGGARRWLCAAAAKVAAAAAAVVAAAPAGAESWKREPRARPGSTRGAAAGTAALLAWAEPRDTGLAGPRQQQWLSMELSPRSPPEMLESDCPSPLELKSAPSKKMWIKLRSL
ncbi:hypothetical protein U0070_010531, partial [Myodes glareolus]